MSCTTNELIYARGSGELVYAQSGEDGHEYERDILAADLQKQLGSASPQFFELASDPNGSAEVYPAVKINGHAALVGVKAVITAGEYGKYADSVGAGVRLLKKYIDDTISSDQGKCFILVGYSQGAHVIGRYITENEDIPSIVSRIRYIGLIGDPKLDLIGVDTIPGKNIPWYRGGVTAVIHEGILQARRPYVPLNNITPVIPTGSWCYNDDPVCAGNLFENAVNNAHGKYVERGAIKAMAKEITDIVKSDQPGAYASKYPATEGCGAQKQDLVVMLDTSPIMRRNANLFTDAPNPLDVRKAADGVTNLPPRTTGQMLLESGCGDKRVAVVGYGRPQDGAPQLLMGFTTNPYDIDALLKSLYAESDSGTYERTQFREAAVLGMSSPWRPDASHSLLALTQFAGTGPSTRWGWSDGTTMRNYMADTLGTEMIRMSREKDVSIGGIVVPLTLWSGYSQAPNETGMGDARTFLAGIAAETGAYNWTRYTDNYAPQTFRKVKVVDTIREAERLHDVSYVTAKPVRGKVGQPMTLNVDDPTNLIASAKLRPGHGIEYNWRPSCNNLVEDPYNTSPTYTFTPSVAGKCKAAVYVTIRGAGAGCYSICPEPFPPYFSQLVTFDIEILPADHHDPLPPGPIQNLVKRIYQDRIEYTWDAPADRGQYSDGQLIYALRDNDGSMLTMTYDPKVTVTDLTDDNLVLSIAAAGQGGAGAPVSSDDATVIDMTPPPPDPAVDPEDDEVIIPVDENGDPEIPGTEVIPGDDQQQPPGEDNTEEGAGSGEVLGENTVILTDAKQVMQPTYSDPQRMLPGVQPVSVQQQTQAELAAVMSEAGSLESLVEPTDSATSGYVASAIDVAAAPQAVSTDNNRRGLTDWVTEDLLWVLVATCLAVLAIIYRQMRQSHT